MNAHIEHQVIEEDGVPLFVLEPYDENFPGVLLLDGKAPRRFSPNDAAKNSHSDRDRGDSYGSDAAPLGGVL